MEKADRDDMGGKRGSSQHRTLQKCNETSEAGAPRKMYEQRMCHPAAQTALLRRNPSIIYNHLWARGNVPHTDDDSSCSSDGEDAETETPRRA